MLSLSRCIKAFLQEDPLCPASFLLARRNVGHLVPETQEKDLALVSTSRDPLVTRRIQNCSIMKIQFGFWDDLLGISRQRTKKMTTLVILMLIQGVPIKVQSELRICYRIGPRILSRHLGN
ncbi:uncharacterized protein LOC134479340 isoform X2 [Rattus norvegicus]|uniref:uncharacterized protein LOC134479340 isoform X2 n=1 Tax=Rattus norvegicus TaxID=10116 RepID=UPI002FD857FE